MWKPYTENDELWRGNIVIAAKHLDKPGADVRPGTMGVVFEETNYYNDGGGPMVKWMNMGACNIYPGDVVFWERENTIKLEKSIGDVIEGGLGYGEIKE